MHREETTHIKSSSAKGVLTMAEQATLAEQKRPFRVLSNGEVFFFTDDPNAMLALLGELNFKLTSVKCPYILTARRNHSSKVIQTAEKYVAIFHRNEKHITSIDELARYLDQVPA